MATHCVVFAAQVRQGLTVEGMGWQDSDRRGRAPTIFYLSATWDCWYIEAGIEWDGSRLLSFGDLSDTPPVTMFTE